MGLLFSEAVDHFPKRLTFEVRTAPSVELAAMSSCSLPAGGQTGASFGGLTQTGLDALSELRFPLVAQTIALWGTARRYTLFSNMHPHQAVFSIDFVTGRIAGVPAME